MKFLQKVLWLALAAIIIFSSLVVGAFSVPFYPLEVLIKEVSGDRRDVLSDYIESELAISRPFSSLVIICGGLLSTGLVIIGDQHD